MTNCTPVLWQTVYSDKYLRAHLFPSFNYWLHPQVDSSPPRSLRPKGNSACSFGIQILWKNSQWNSGMSYLRCSETWDVHSTFYFTEQKKSISPLTRYDMISTTIDWVEKRWQRWGYPPPPPQTVTSYHQVSRQSYLIRSDFKTKAWNPVRMVAGTTENCPLPGPYLWHSYNNSILWIYM